MRDAGVPALDGVAALEALLDHESAPLVRLIVVSFRLPSLLKLEHIRLYNYSWVKLSLGQVTALLRSRGY